MRSSPSIPMSGSRSTGKNCLTPPIWTRRRSSGGSGCGSSICRNCSARLAPGRRTSPPPRRASRAGRTNALVKSAALPAQQTARMPERASPRLAKGGEQKPARAGRSQSRAERRRRCAAHHRHRAAQEDRRRGDRGDAQPPLPPQPAVLHGMEQRGRPPDLSHRAGPCVRSAFGLSRPRAVGAVRHQHEPQPVRHRRGTRSPRTAIARFAGCCPAGRRSRAS